MVFISVKDPSDWYDQISYLSTAAKKKCLSWRYRKFEYDNQRKFRKISTKNILKN